MSYPRACNIGTEKIRKNVYIMKFVSENKEREKEGGKGENNKVCLCVREEGRDVWLETTDLLFLNTAWEKN